MFHKLSSFITSEFKLDLSLINRACQFLIVELLVLTLYSEDKCGARAIEIILYIDHSTERLNYLLAYIQSYPDACSVDGCCCLQFSK
jgi:hypothetical protein